MNTERKRELKIIATEIVANMATEADVSDFESKVEELHKTEAEFVVSQVNHIGETLRNRVKRMKE
ncbi:hypothetical protein GCM10023188_14000 [Pontibacter saemangeumensis]|uniref:Uncharacterized protein n=1 Tax=Pontibacter saemangeumensis TaxID=1084525 RepID=A0ABP8LHN9_9BACT